MSNVKWTLYGHPRNRTLKTIVCYAAISSRASTVLAVIPLYDLRDTDYDGKVGWGETAWPWVPFVGGAVTVMQEVELMMAIAMELKDGDLYLTAQRRALDTAFKTADKAFRKNSLATLVTMPVARALELFPLDTISSYIVNKAWEHAVEKLLGV